MSERERKTILLVEDEVIIAMFEKQELESYGYSVKLVTNGEDAIQEALNKNINYDLILMDIDLGSGIDGTQAAELILKEKDLPVVFLSSHTEPEVVEKTEKITSYGYVVKNSSITVLDASIKMAFKLFDAKVKMKMNEEALLKSEETIMKKLKAITEPEGDISSLELADILDYKGLQVMMEDFYQFSKIGSAIVDSSGKILVAVGWQDICTKFHRVHPDTLKNCIESDTYLTQNVQAGAFKTYHCMNNMWDISTPIIIDEKHLGNIFLGQFFFEEEIPDYDFFKKQALLYGFDEKEYLDALDRAPRWNKKTINSVMTFYSKLAGMISSLSYATIKLSKNIEKHKQMDVALRESELTFRKLFEDSADAILLIDKTGVFVECNQAALTLLKMTREEFLLKPPVDISPEYQADGQKSKDKALKMVEIAYEKGLHRFDWTCINTSGDEFIVEVSLMPIKIKGETMLHTTWRDITDRKRMEEKIKIQNEELAVANEELNASLEEMASANEELKIANRELQISKEALKESEERFKALHNASFGGIAIHDKGIILECNQGLANVTGYSVEELIGMNGLLLIAEKSRNYVMNRIQSGYEKPYESIGARKNGEEYYLRLEARNIPYKGKMVRVVEFRDVTDRKKADTELKLKDNAIESSINAIVFTDMQGKLSYVNESFIKMWGFDKKEEVIGQLAVDFLESSEKALEIIDNLNKKGFCKSELKAKKKNNELFDVQLSASLIKDDNGELICMMASLEDITDRKQAVIKFETYIRNSPTSIFITNSEADYTYVNQVACDLLRYTENELLSMNIKDVVYPSEYEKSLKTFPLLLKGEKVHQEIALLRKDGEKVDVILDAVMLDEKNIIGFCTNISAQKEAEKEIQKQLNEKESLLKEVHHRVKNNIANIKGLLLLQAESSPNPDIQIALKEAGSRIESIMVLYEKLLLDKDYREIKLKNYIESLIESIIEIFPESSKIVIEKRIDDFIISGKKASSIGIMLNELLTNVFKYAFFKKDNCKVLIDLKKVENSITLIIHDNGIGIDDRRKLNKSEGFGITIVKMLSEQLNGTFKMENDNGTKCVIEFNL